MQAYHWPKNTRNQPKEAFNPARARACKEAGKFKSLASGLLDLYPVFRRMVSDFGLRQTMRQQVSSLEAMFRVLDMLLLFSFDMGDVDALLKFTRPAMAWHKRAYKDSILVPKRHAALHLPKQILDRGRAWGTHVLERKHEAFKEIATSKKNLSNLEQSVAVRMPNHQVNGFNDSEGHVFQSGAFLVMGLYEL